MENYLYTLFPFSDQNKDEVLNEINMIVKSNAIGIPLLAVIQGIVAVIGYLSFRLRSAVIWFLTCIATIIPIVGPHWSGFVGGLYGLNGDWYMPWIGYYALLVITNVDNLIRLSYKEVGGYTSVNHRLRSRNRVVLIRIYGDHLRAVVIILIPSLYRYLQEELFG